MNQNGALGDLALRQAVLRGLDKETYTSVLLEGGATPGKAPVPPTLDYGYDDLNDENSYDPEGAKKLLDDAGIVDTDGDGIREIDGENINLHYVSYENRLLNDFSNAHIQYLAEIGIGCTADTAVPMTSGANLLPETNDFKQ